MHLLCALPNGNAIAICSICATLRYFGMRQLRYAAACHQVACRFSQSGWLFLGELKMLTKKTLVSALFAASIIGVAAMPLPSMAEDVISLNFGPPAAQYEAVPVAREGYIWSPGYYNYENDKHVWVKGESVPAREGYTYQPNRWQEKDGHWNLERARWEPK